MAWPRSSCLLARREGPPDLEIRRLPRPDHNMTAVRHHHVLVGLRALHVLTNLAVNR
ncbi:hypothetical protein ACWC2T_30025 [Streptomyces sp. NPDC001393]